MSAVYNNIKNNYLKIIITLLPILDIISYFLVDTKFTIITTSIRILMVVFLFVYSFIKSKSKKSYLVFVLVVAFYLIGHIYSCYTNGYVSILNDISNLARIIYMPVLLFALINLFKYNKDYEGQIVKGMSYGLGIIVVSIILALITGTGNFTYPNNTGITGWFYNKNSQSLIISIISFIVATYNIENKKYYLLMIVIFLLLYFNATKASYISLVVLLVFLVVYLFIKKMKKKAIFTLIILVLSFGLFGVSPTNKNLMAYNDIQDVNTKLNEEENIDEEIDTTDEELTEEEKELLEYQSIYDKYGFAPLFNKFGTKKVIEKYDYTKDSYILNNNRTKKKTVANLIYEDENVISHMFGFEYTKISNIEYNGEVYNYDLESDITAMYYYCGWIGIFLYFGFIVYLIIKMVMVILKKIKIIGNPYYMVWLLLIFMMILGSEFSGDLLRRPNSNFYLAMIIAVGYTKFRELKNNDD